MAIKSLCSVSIVATVVAASLVAGFPLAVSASSAGPQSVPTIGEDPYGLAAVWNALEPDYGFPGASVNHGTNLALRLEDLDEARRIANVIATMENPLAAAIQIVEVSTGVFAPGLDSGPAWPSLVASRLIEEYGGLPTEEQFWAIVSLDAQPAPARTSLAHLLEAHLKLQRAVSITSFDMFGPSAAASPDLLSARAELLDAIWLFSESVPAASESGAGASSSSMSDTKVPPVQVPGILSIDLEVGMASGSLDCSALGVDDVYVTDFAVLIDRCGNDTYLNNAGGSSLNGGTCATDPGNASAAVLVDLRGDDSYASGRSCGANGGGFNGVGVLVDKGGNDTYIAGSFGTNGGGHQGLGLLIDVPGEIDARASVDVRIFPNVKVTVTFSQSENLFSNDQYHATAFGTNGGGSLGAGFLVDFAGNDLYNATGFGVNGGGYQHGSGHLVDGGGDDTYRGTRDGVNGGASTAASGMLIDTGGSDHYAATVGRGSNGGGFFVEAHGLLVDLSGNDIYDGGSFAVNGAAFGGGGALLDLQGNDVYVGSQIANGAAESGISGGDARGILLDARGTDSYNDGTAAGTGTDITQVPKGTFGMQVDLPLP